MDLSSVVNTRSNCICCTGELGKLGFICLPCLTLAAGGRGLHTDGGCQVDLILIFSLLIVNSGRGSTLSSPWQAWACSTLMSWTRSSVGQCRPSPPGTSRCSVTRASLRTASHWRVPQLSSSLRYWPAITRMNSVLSCSLSQVHLQQFTAVCTS